MIRGDFRAERPEFAQIDPDGRKPPLVAVLDEFEVIAGFDAQGAERRRGERSLPLGGDLDT